jgi:hypothetical protein
LKNASSITDCPFKLDELIGNNVSVTRLSPSTSLNASRSFFIIDICQQPRAKLIMKITTINPAINEAVMTYDEMTPEEAESAVAQAHATW